MPKPDGTMTFEEWLQEEVRKTEFDQGDSPETFLKLGKEVLEEEIRKEQRLRVGRLKKLNKLASTLRTNLEAKSKT